MSNLVWGLACLALAAFFFVGALRWNASRQERLPADSPLGAGAPAAGAIHVFLVSGSVRRTKATLV